jgi:hypothetical protein
MFPQSYTEQVVKCNMTSCSFSVVNLTVLYTIMIVKLQKIG